jgi:hypothetical protein
MYSRKTGLILAFHGCDKSVVDDVILGKENLRKSENSYDWLGHGFYFWENSPSRAIEYACSLKENPHRAKQIIDEPAVLGAVLDLGYCLDLLDYENLKLLKSAYEIIVETNNKSGNLIPINKKLGAAKELLLRDLDCAVVETLHKVREETAQQPYDSVRGVFWEGDKLYENAGFREKDHIQICVRNPNCIKGFFLPRQINSSYNRV